MIASSVKAKLLVFTVFLVGMLTGGLFYNVYETRWSADADATTEKKSQKEVGQFYDFLGLSAEQRKQWKSIMQDSKPEFDKLFAENRKLTAPNQPKFDALQEETRNKIRAILTEEQRKKYNEFHEKRRQRQPESRSK